MRILLTNDDGIDAPGLTELEAKSAALGQVTVVAPTRERSGAGHSLTMHEPLRVVAHGDGRWACSGTPVDCVYVALHKLFDGTPDLVISGINRGANLGDDVFYSGTVGAAREAALNGLQALAVSLDLSSGPQVPERHFATASAVLEEVARGLMENPLPDGVYLNLNVPNIPLAEVKGVRVCALGRRHYDPLVEERVDPRGKAYYWIGGSPVASQMPEGTDGRLISQGYATVTPLGLNNTKLDFLKTIERWAHRDLAGE